MIITKAISGRTPFALSRRRLRLDTTRLAALSALETKAFETESMTRIAIASVFKRSFIGVY